MCKIAIIYGSTTGKTETAAHIIGAALKYEQLHPSLMDVAGLAVTELDKDYDLILLGSSTWGDEDVELQEDFAEFYEMMEDAHFEDRRFAVFGCGDSGHPVFCGAVELIEEKVEECGGELVSESLKIDGDPVTAREEIFEWADTVALGLAHEVDHN